MAGEKTAKSQDFIVKEYETLQNKMMNAVNGLNRIEMAVPIAMAAVYSWTFSFGRSEAAINILLGLPVMLALFGYVRTYTLYRYVHRLEAYVSQLEGQLYAGKPDMGWERNHGAFAANPRHPESLGVLSWFTQRQLRLGTWFTLLLVSVGVWGLVGLDLIPVTDRAMEVPATEQATPADIPAVKADISKARAQLPKS